MSPGLSTIDLSSLTSQLEAVQVKMLPYTMATKPSCGDYTSIGAVSQTINPSKSALPVPLMHSDITLVVSTNRQGDIIGSELFSLQCSSQQVHARGHRYNHFF